VATINPYINFNGNCEEAFKFYKSVFGGEFDSFQRFNETPSSEHLVANEKEWIMHVSLPIGGDTFLMGSDSPAAMGKVTAGNNVQISIQTDNDAETDRLFNGLSAGGQVTMPLQNTFWGARFGMFVDQFGIQWMINQPIGENA
jgi:PhnB protein